jgi:biotin-(acetyl-CoA carboxylase) ligase
VNLKQRHEDFPAEIRERATSVDLEEGRAELLPLLTHYLVGLLHLSDALGAGYRQQLLDIYLDVCATIGRRVRATTDAGEEVVGRAVGIGVSGELLIETSSGLSRVGFGEIGHLD